jgi:hypothetical protein
MMSQMTNNKPLTERDFEIPTLPKGVTTIGRVREAKRLLKQKLELHKRVANNQMDLSWKGLTSIIDSCFQIDDGK